MKVDNFIVWYNYGSGLLEQELLGKFNNLKEARKCVQSDKRYDESLFDKFGDPLDCKNNKYFTIYDDKIFKKWEIKKDNINIEKEEYIIYCDATWNSKIPDNAFSAMIVYLNGEKIFEDSKRLKDSTGQEELRSINRAINIVCDKYCDNTKIQSFVFKTDAQGLHSKCNDILKTIRIKNKIQVQKCIENPNRRMLFSAISRFIKIKENIDIKFQWIPREQNQEADELANQCYDSFLIKQGFKNSKKYMKDELEYSLNKWRYWFNDDKSLKYVNKLESFIAENFY